MQQAFPRAENALLQSHQLQRGAVAAEDFNRVRRHQGKRAGNDDEGDAVRKAFAVPKAAFGLLPGRVTYVLDKNGVCQKVYDDLTGATAHVDVAKTALKSLSKGGGAPAKPLFRK